MNKKKSNFSGQLGFVLAAAGSAVGVGNLAFSVSGGKGRRRTVLSHLSGTGLNIWIHTAGI